MSDEERQVMMRLLSVDFPGADALRTQAAAITGVEPSCQCGCPSLTPQVDRRVTPPADCGSPIPPELVEMDRADGIERTVICFLDQDGYLANLECVYYDDAVNAWPRPEDSAVLVRDTDMHLMAANLPSGALVQPQDANDRWASFEIGVDGGFCSSTWQGYRECYGPDGSLQSREFTK